MFVIGITGGIGTGKSHAVKVLRKLGAMVWDADRAARAVVKPNCEGWQAIKDAFGDQFFRDDETLDRKAMSDDIFSSKEKIKQLNAALHPIIIDDMESKLSFWEDKGVKVAIIDAPLLFETGIEKYCDEVWTLSCGVDEQIRRVMARDSLSYDEVQKRIDAQMDDKERRKRANRIIDTYGDIKDTERLLKTLYEEIIDEIE